MPLLAAFLGSIFGKVLDFFMKYFTRKIAMFTTVIVTITALTAVLLAAFIGILAGIAVALPPSVASFTAFVPSNSAACLAAVSSARLLKWTYDWNAQFVQRALF